MAAQLRELDCDPIAGMAKLANAEDIPAWLRARMFAELATYVAPKRKAMELTGPDGHSLADHGYDFDLLSADEMDTLHALIEKARVPTADER